MCDGRKAVVDVEGMVVDSVGVVKSGGGIAFDVSALGMAVDHMPRVLHGRLDDGTAVTLLDAQMMLRHRGLPGVSMQFTGFRLVQGAHVDRDEDVTGVRWTTSITAAAGWMREGPQSSVMGLLTSWGADGLAGLQVELAAPMPIDKAAGRIPAQVVSFFNLTLSSDVTVVHRQIRLTDGRWCPYGVDREVSPRSTGELLEPLELSMSHLAVMSRQVVQPGDGGDLADR